MPVYQVCECTTVAAAAALAITRSADSVDSAGLAPFSAGSGWWTNAPVARGAHAVHVDFAQAAQLRDEFCDVHAGPAVHLGWILPRHHRHPHAYDGSSTRAPAQPCGPTRLSLTTNRVAARHRAGIVPMA